MNILHIDSSPHGQSSGSRKSTTDLVISLKRTYPNGTITYRDLNYQPPVYLTNELRCIAEMPGERRTPEQVALLKYSDAAIAEILAADIVVLEAPTYNLMVSADLKAWLDLIIRVDKTHTDEQRALAAAKKLFVITSRGGGSYGSDEPIEVANFQDSYLRAAFKTIGITDIQFLYEKDIGHSTEKTGKWGIKWPSLRPARALSYGG